MFSHLFTIINYILISDSNKKKKKKEKSNGLVTYEKIKNKNYRHLMYKKLNKMGLIFMRIIGQEIKLQNKN